MSYSLKKLILESNQVNSVDNRGYYITNMGPMRGAYYLYADGKVRLGAETSESSAFWKTREEAEAFLADWTEEHS